MKRFICVVLAILSLSFVFPVQGLACDESQSNLYVQKMLFGNNISMYEGNDDVETLLNALYVCSAQSDHNGQDKLSALKKARVRQVPSLRAIDVSNDRLFECTHTSWEHISETDEEQKENRKELLRRAVVRVFNFGWFQEQFGRSRGQIDGFSAFLYYAHILADHLNDDPLDTEFSAKGYDIPAYSGCEIHELNGNQPEFSQKQKRSTECFKEYSDLDAYGRCGPGTACIGPETLKLVEPRNSISHIKPIGWNNKYYDGVMAEKQTLYNRCHLVAHSLGGHDTRYNLVTGTRYLNETMEQYEGKVARYIQESGNHVLYRVTPVYVGTNEVVSGVQMEGYSIEDKGKGICFNIYCYNVQPGVDIDYSNGNSEMVDQTLMENEIIPFAVSNPNESSPDLMFEIRKQLAIIFGDQKESTEYKMMMDALDKVSDEARNLHVSQEWKRYQELKALKYEYWQTLCQYVPELLAKEKFFISVFD